MIAYCLLKRRDEADGNSVVTQIASPNAAEAVALRVEAQRKVKPVATVADQVTP